MSPPPTTTTQILFNSPALHSLKRDQLVKLCKIHSLKASGKNDEIVQRLKLFALTLDRDAVTSGDEHEVENREEEEARDGLESGGVGARGPWGFQAPRPSEQWEVVMEDIEELEESSSQGTMTSLRTLGGNPGEFGTEGGSKSSSVSSSLRALASHLRLKSGTSLSQTSTLLPSKSSSSHYSVPLDSPLALQDIDPIPGHTSRPGKPAPPNARLSVGSGILPGPTTTIRLVTAKPRRSSIIATSMGGTGTPKLKPWKTSFDLVLGSPVGGTGSGERMSVWPPREVDEDEGKLYPSLDAFVIKNNTNNLKDVNPDMPDMAASSAVTSLVLDPSAIQVIPPLTHRPPSNEIIDLFSPSKPSSATPLSLPRSPAFVFGSPLSGAANQRFQFQTAASSVLEEMNKRLASEGVEAIGMDILAKNGKNSSGVDHGVGKRQKGGASASGGEKEEAEKEKQKFDRIHEEAFSKMESITSYATRHGCDAPPTTGTKRKSSALVAIVDSGGKKAAAGGKRMGIPGGFGDELEDEDEDPAHDPGADTNDAEDSQNRRLSKRPRVSHQPLEDEMQEIGRAQREREAIRRRLEREKIKRRSSAALTGGGVLAAAAAKRRSSVVRPVVGNANAKSKGKGTRFGFLSSARSIVASVWGGGNANGTKVSSSSTNGGAVASATAASATSTKPTPAAISGIPKPKADEGKGSGRSISGLVRVLSGSGSGSGNGSVGLKRVGKEKEKENEKEKEKSFGTNTKTRAPIPRMFTSGSSGAGIGAAGTGDSSRGKELSHSHQHGRGSTSTSLGSRPSAASSAEARGTSSLGVRPRTGGESSVGRTSITSTRGSLGAGSRLMAPTASSLAKMSGVGSGVSRQSSGSGEQPPPFTFVNPNPNSSLSSSTNSKPKAKSKSKATSRIPLPSPKERVGKIFSSPIGSPRAVGDVVMQTFAEAGAVLGATGSQQLNTATSAHRSDEAGEKPEREIQTKPKALASGGGGGSSLNGRKPRISRTKVIAKLATQRAAAAAASSSTAGLNSMPRVSTGTPGGRTRSSLGAGVGAGKVKRIGGGRGSGGLGGDVLMGARKRARQSEYARRRSSRVDNGAGAGTGQ